MKNNPFFHLFNTIVKMIWMLVQRVLVLVALVWALVALIGPRLMRLAVFPTHETIAVPSVPATIVVHPVPDNTMLINPGKGWVEYYGPTAYTNDLISVEYTRPCWADLEPSEGKYNWKVFDSYIETWTKYGKKAAIGVINTDGGRQYSTPKWVFDAGAVPLAMPAGYLPEGNRVIPKAWDDPVYIAKMKKFIAAFGARYNGNPNLAFVDIRSYGDCGECNGAFPKFIGNTTQDNLKNNHFGSYIQAFPNTQLIAPWTAAWFDGKSAEPIYAWAVSKGVGIRRDGICSHWSKDGSECLLCYGHAPAVHEYADTWAGTVKDGNESPETLMRYVHGGKPSYMQFHPEFYEANKDFCHMLGNKIGYHFILRRAEIPGTIQAGVPFPLKLTWLNDGVAPLYEPCRVALALLDKNNNVVEKQWLLGSNPKSWMPDAPATEGLNVTFSSVPSEGYKVALGLFLSQKDANPAYKLGILGRIPSGWYILTGDAMAVPTSWANSLGGSWASGSNWSGCTYRSGVGAIADFSTLDLTGNATVTLDDAVTVGHLVFGDITPSHHWLLASGSGGSLTLRVSSGAPTITVKNQTTTCGGTIISYRGLTKDGSGTLILSGSLGLHGNTRIDDGVLEIARSTKLYTSWQGSEVTVGAGATLRVNGWSGYGGGWGELDQIPMDKPNSLRLDGGTLEFTGSNGGNGSRAFGIGVGGATLKNSSKQGWRLTSSGTGAMATVTNDSGLTLDGVGPNSVLDKGISGCGSLTKRGEGTWLLTGSNTYKGPTTISQGTLQMLGSLAAESAVTVSETGALSGTGRIGGPVTVHGTLAPGAGAVGALTISNALTLTGTTSLRLCKAGTNCFNDNVRGVSRLTCGGALIVSAIGGTTFAAGDTFTLFSARSYSGAFTSILLPPLNAGLRWSSSNLAVNGAITVVGTH